MLLRGSFAHCGYRLCGMSYFCRPIGLICGAAMIDGVWAVIQAGGKQTLAIINEKAFFIQDNGQRENHRLQAYRVVLLELED